MVATVGARVGAVTVVAVMAVARVVAAKARAVAAGVEAPGKLGLSRRYR